jgi:hypothetical protein
MSTQIQTPIESTETISNELLEARAIAWGASTKTPTVRHIEALALSLTFWKLRAKEATERLALLEAVYDQRALLADDLAEEMFGCSSRTGE